MIRLVNVYKAFGEKKVLEGFSLEVNEGETVVIIGFSGSGKSVDDQAHRRPARARFRQVFVDGKEVPTLPRRELYELRASIGYVFQFAALFDSFSIGDNVAMGLRKQGKLSESEIRSASPRRSSWSISPTRGSASPPSSRAACASGWASHAASRSAPSTSSTMSPRRGSIR